MTLAVWVICGGFALIWFGTWALQIALTLLQMCLRLAGAAAVLVFGLASLLALALIDRRELARIWRRHRADQTVASTLARERWS